MTKTVVADATMAVAVVSEDGRRGFALWDHRSRSVGVVVGGLRELWVAVPKGSLDVVELRNPWRLSDVAWGEMLAGAW